MRSTDSAGGTSSRRKREKARRPASELPYEGSIPDLEQALRGLDRSSRPSEAELARIYRDPTGARRALDRQIRTSGPIETFRRLEAEPETYGRLYGRKILGQPTRARSVVLDHARQTGEKLARLESHRVELAEAIQTSERNNAEIVELYRDRGQLGKDRGRLLGTLRDRAAGLDLAQLRGRVSAQHLVVLKDLESADDIHLAPLRNALHTFREARTARTPRRQILRLARNLASLYRATPRGLLRRLAPRHLKLLLTATTMVIAVVRKVVSEEPDQHRARRSLRL